MSIKIVRTGKELEIQAAMAYLERRYGMPAAHVSAVAVDGRVGSPMKITVTVYVQRENEATPAPDPSPGERLRAGMPEDVQEWRGRWTDTADMPHQVPAGMSHEVPIDRAYHGPRGES